MAKEMNKAKTGANAVITVALIIVGVVLFNVIANRFFARVDFTADKIYTLSQASRDLVSKLPDRMTIKAYISDDLQPPFSQTAQFVRDLLSEYAQASKGKLVWEAVDPGKDSKLEEEATKNKVAKTRRGRVSSNKVEIGASYLGVALQYQGNIESIPEINGAEGLEFELTRLIKMMTVKKKKIAFANGEGELSTAGDPQGGHGGLQIVGQYMKDYEVTQVNLGTGEKLADDIDALVVAGPKTQFSDKAKFTIDQFLMRGRSVALLVDGMVVEAPRQMQMPGMDSQPRIGRKNDVGLEDLLENYGFKIKDDLVLEPRQNVPGPVPVAGQMFLANYPTFVAATKLAQKNSITDHVNAVVMPFCSSVEKVKDKQPNVTYTELVTSTEQAWRQSGFFLFDPQNAQLKVGEDKGPFALAWSANGRFKSLFAGKPAPEGKTEKRDESESTARLIVVGDSDFAADDYLRFGRQIPAYGSNLLLFMNMMDYLVADDALAPLRAKGVQSRPITVGSEATPSLAKWGNVVGVPLLFIIFGVIRWRMRTARRRSAQI